MKKKKNIVLVTGATGFIGKNIAKHFSKNGWYVIGISLEKLDKKEFGKLGIREYYSGKISKSILSKVKKTPDLIVHCAGSGSVGLSLEKPKKDFEMNVGSLLEVLEFMRLRFSKSKLIYPSSAAVYGQKDDAPIKEEDSLKPVSPYGFHKKIAENLCESYSKNFNLNISIVRLFSVYGAGIQKQLLWDACEKISKAEKEIVFFGTGDETRDWIHINDVTELFLVIARSQESFEVLNGASGLRTKINSVLKILLKEYKKPLKIVFNNVVRKGDPKYYHADIEKIISLGWEPKVSLAIGIKDYVNYFKKNND